MAGFMRHSKAIKQLRDEERTSFLKLDPVDRMLRMEKVLHEVLAIKASAAGVTEYEIYRRYLERDKKRRHGV